jgi:hypothetical protein
LSSQYRFRFTRAKQQKLRDVELQNQTNKGRKIEMSFIVSGLSTAHRVLVASSSGM